MVKMNENIACRCFGGGGATFWTYSVDIQLSGQSRNWATTEELFIHSFTMSENITKKNFGGWGYILTRPVD